LDTPPARSPSSPGSACEGPFQSSSAIIPVLAGLPDGAIFFGVAFIVVLISLILQGWTVATAAHMFDLDVPPLKQTSRLDIDLPGVLGDENTVARPQSGSALSSRFERRRSAAAPAYSGMG